MTDTTFDALQSEIDKNEADEAVLSENIIEDAVTVANGNVIANEQQAILGWLGLATGLMWPHGRNVNSVLTGPSAGGKSDTQGAIQRMLPMDVGYEVTDASNKGVLDDERWESAAFAPLDEWQKIPEELTEMLKSLSGGPDDEYRYTRSVPKEDGNGRTNKEIVKKAKPYQFLYAQHALDHELSTRLLFLPIDDNVRIREAIIEKQGGASEISVEGYDKEFIFETLDRERAIRQRLREVPTECVEMADGRENFRGSVDGYLPAWVRKSVKPVFDMSRTETNRVSGQVFNLIRASAVVNHVNRRETTVTDDGTELTAYVATPQDAANVLAARETLLAKTHHLTTIKMEIVDAIRAHQFEGGSSDDGVGVTLKTIRDYLDDSSSLSVPGKDKLRDLLRELDEHFYITIHERAAADGTSHLYEFNSLRDIGVPRVANLEQYLDADELADCREHAPEVNLEAPYEDATDPFRDQPFVETVEDLSDDLSQNPVERAAETADLVADKNQGDDGGDGGLAAAEAMGGSGGDGGQSTLVGGDGGDGDGGAPDGVVERAVHERLLEHADGNVFDINSVEDGHLVGAVEDTDVSLAAADVSGTIYDPDHDLWSQATKPDDWVSSESRAESEIEQALTALENKGIVAYDAGDATMPDDVVKVIVDDA